MLKIPTLQQDSDEQPHPFPKRMHSILIMRKQARQQMFTHLRDTLPPPLWHQNTPFPQEDKQEETTSPADLMKKRVNELLEAPVSPQQFGDCIKKLYNDDPFIQVEGVIGIRKIIYENTSFLERLADSRTHTRLIKIMLEALYKQLKVVCTWLLAEIAYEGNDGKQAADLVKPACLNQFMHCLKSSNIYLVRQCVLALGWLGATDASYRDSLLNAGVMSALLALLPRCSDSQLIADIGWAISSLCKNMPLPEYSAIKDGLMTLAYLLAEGVIVNEDDFVQLLWAVSYHCNAQVGHEDCVMDTNLIDKMIVIAREQPQKIQVVRPCLQVISNVLLGPRKNVEYMVGLGVMPILQDLLSSRSIKIRKEVCLCFSNIVASGYPFSWMIYDNKELTDHLMKMLLEEGPSLQIQICAIFCTMCYYEQLNMDLYFKHNHILPALVNLAMSEDTSIVVDALKLLRQPIQAGRNLAQKRKGHNVVLKELIELGIHEQLESLQYSESDLVYETVKQLLEAYFDLEDPLEKCDQRHL